MGQAFRGALAAVGLIVGVGLVSAWAADLPAGYPAAYQDIIAAAGTEGRVVIYSTTDAVAVGPLLKDFRALYPKITIEYTDLNSTEVYNRFISEAAAGGGTADLLWSSSMDLQIKLVQDGYGQAYDSPESAALPAWSTWRHEAYGITYEPLAFIYNKRLVPPAEVPASHAALTKLLTEKPAAYAGKITAYDPERSGVGFLLATQDVIAAPTAAWDQFKAVGAAGARLYTSAGAMLERIASGEHLIGFNIFASYALAKAKKDPNLGVVLPNDYCLIMSRIAFIPKAAKNPNAAKLFLDYLLSRRGQTIIANQAELFAIRTDVEGEATAAAVGHQLGDKVRPIPVDGSLLAYLDQTKRLEFLKAWQQAIKGK